jgi:chromosome partitioning protein
MQTLAVIAQKGGVGKTTVARHLRSRPLRSGRSRSSTSTRRQAPLAGPTAARPRRPRLCGQGLGRHHDTAPHAESQALAAARAADLIMIPTRPGILDLRAIGASVETANLAKRPAVLVINAAPRGGAAQESAEAARETCGVEARSAVISQRAVFGHTLVGGQVAQEVEPAAAPSRWHGICLPGGSGRSSQTEATPHDPARTTNSHGARLPGHASVRI